MKIVPTKTKIKKIVKELTNQYEIIKTTSQIKSYKKHRISRIRNSIIYSSEIGKKLSPFLWNMFQYLLIRKTKVNTSSALSIFKQNFQRKNNKKSIFKNDCIFVHIDFVLIRV